jgi:peptide/nickel transport system permease protein
VKQFTALLKSPWFLFGSSVFSICVLTACFYPLLSTIDPIQRTGAPFYSPSMQYWLGTNNQGQDMFARLVFGLRASLYVGLFAGIIATCLGTTIGMTAGYRGGILDNILSMATNLFLVIPSLIILILISNSIEKRSLTLVALIIGCTQWTWTARAVRAQTSSLRSRDHISLAKLNGYGTVSIILKHILPYILSYIFMAFILQMASGILSEAAISMLGLGPYDSVSLGTILYNAQQHEALINGNWWVFLPAAFLVSMITFSLYMVNTAMEGVFNPRLRR